MSGRGFHGRGFRGSGGARGGFRGRGRGRGGSHFDSGPPEQVIEFGYYGHPCEGDLVCKATLQDLVPYFNAPIFLQDKTQIGKVDEIYGPIRDYHVSIKLSENMKAESFEKKLKLFIDPNKLLPLERFLPKPPGEKKALGGGRGRGGRGGGQQRGFQRGGFQRGSRGFGGRGGFRGGRGGSRGFSRGRGNFGSGSAGAGFKRKTFD